MVLIIILSITSKPILLTLYIINELIFTAVINILFLSILMFFSNKFSWLTNYTRAIDNKETNSSDLLPGVSRVLVIPLKNYYF